MEITKKWLTNEENQFEFKVLGGYKLNTESINKLIKIAQLEGELKALTSLYKHTNQTYMMISACKIKLEELLEGSDVKVPPKLYGELSLEAHKAVTAYNQLMWDKANDNGNGNVNGK